jgi:CBS domain-containing protein
LCLAGGNIQPQPEEAKPAPMNVGAICNQNVMTLCADATLSDAAQLLCSRSVDAIVVIASAVPRPTAIGIITDRDIVRAMLDHGGKLAGLRVLDILSRRPLMLNQDEEVDSAMLKLRAADIRHAPVIGSGGTLRGAISREDLVNHCQARGGFVESGGKIAGG